MTLRSPKASVSRCSSFHDIRPFLPVSQAPYPSTFSPSGSKYRCGCSDATGFGSRVC